MLHVSQSVRRRLLLIKHIHIQTHTHITLSASGLIPTLAMLPHPTNASPSSSPPDAPLPPRPVPSAVPVHHATGLISQSTWSQVQSGLTTLHTRQVFGTLIGSLYAHYAESKSSVLRPTPVIATTPISSTMTEEIRLKENKQTVSQSSSSSTATPVVQADLTPVSVIQWSEVNDQLVTVFTTQVYQTSISGFPAQFTRTTWNIVSSTHDPGTSLSGSSETHSIRSSSPSIHFPTAVRSRTPSITTITSVTTTTVTAMASVSPASEYDSGKESNSHHPDHDTHADQLHTPINQLNNRSQSYAPDEHDEPDDGSETDSSDGRDEYENYAEDGDPEAAHPVEDQQQLHSRHRPPRDENAQPFLSLDDEEPETRSDNSRNRKTEFSASSPSLFADLNERVSAPADSSPQAQTQAGYRQDLPLRYAGVFGQRVTHRNQKPTDQREKQSEAGPAAAVSSRQQSTHSHPSPDRPPNHRTAQRKSLAANRHPSVPDPESITPESRAAGHRVRGGTHRRSRPVHQANDSHSHKQAVRPSKRRNDVIRTNARYRSPEQRNRPVDELSATHSRRPANKRRNHSNSIVTITLPPAEHTPAFLSYAGHPTPSLSSFVPRPKSTLTVTSIASWTKTLPIKHGFRTSYATITSSGFNTSLIRPDEYEVRVDATNPNKLMTVLSREPIDANSVQTQIIVTSISLSEVKLVPIRVGFSTRTETQTSSYVLTTLKTIYSTPVLPPSFTFLTSAASHVTTQTLTATSVVSLVVAGKTLLSTLTSTSFKEETIRTTKTVPLPLFSASSTSSTPSAFLFTTLVTFQLTGDRGDVTNVVTPITLPIPSPHTKVERREIRPSARPQSPAAIPAHDLLPSLSPSFPAPPTLFASFSSPLPPVTCHSDSCLTQSLTTVFKGPTTELYRETAVVIKEVRKPVHKKAFKEDKYATDGFRRRKLHQFGDDFAFNSNPQSSNSDPFFRDFSRVVTRPQSFPGSDVPAKPIDRPAFDSVPQLAPNNFGGRSGFQRVRVPNPLPVRVPVQQLPPQLPPAGFSPAGGDNAPFARFQRVVAPAAVDHQPRPQSNFRRVPVFSSQLPPSAPPPPQPHMQSPPPIPQFATSPAPSTSSQPFREEDTPVPLIINPTSRPTGTSERPAFRRLRPGSQTGTSGRRVRPTGSRIRENNNENSIPTFETTTPAATTTTRATTENVDSISSTPESRRIVRIRKPGSAGSRRRVAVRPASGSTVRVPIQRDPADEERVNNALDGDESPNTPNTLPGSFGSRLQEDSGNVSPARPAAHVVSRASDIVPITYYTTYTYLTTVLRGSHTLVTSRLSSTSAISSQVLDESAIHFLKQSGGSIVPTKVVNIGSKTKGPTTTIVNIASEIRATHSDLAHILTASDAPSIRNTRKPLIEAPSEELKTIAPGQLDSIPKTLLTKYTYYYTIIDGTNTRKSTRSEVASSSLPGNH